MGSRPGLVPGHGPRAGPMAGGGHRVSCHNPPHAGRTSARALLAQRPPSGPRRTPPRLPHRLHAGV